MKKKLLSNSGWGGILLLLLLFFVTACQKNNELTNEKKANGILQDNNATSTAEDGCAYYLSLSAGKLYVTEKFIDLCKADLDIKMISNALWQIGYPVNARVKVYIVKSEVCFPAEKPALNDLRVRPNYTCEGIKPAVDSCANSGSRSYHVTIGAYKICIPAQLATCQDAYIAVGTGKAYSGPDCTGDVIGSARIYKWVCGPL